MLIKTKKLILNNWHIFALGALISLVFTSHLLYVIKTYQFPQWDENVYLQYAVDFLPIFKKPSLSLWQNILSITQHRQPFYPLFISIPLLFLGTSFAYKTALLLNCLFYATTILFTYLTARQFFDKLSSFLASYMFAFYGFPLFYLHFTLEETTATAFVTIALYFLIKALRNFSHKYTLLFSFFASTAVLVRWTTPIFLLGPFLLFLFIYLKKIINRKINKSYTFKTILILILVGAFPAAILYYYPNISYFLGYAEANRVGGPEWVPELIRNPFSKSSVIWYASILAQQTIFFWVLFLAGLSIALMRFKRYSFLLLAFIIPYLFFTLGAVWKEDRFIVPSYPMMAIISAIVIYELRKKTPKVVLTICIIVLGFLNFIGASWGIGPMKFSIHGDKFTVPHSIVIPMPIGHPRRIWLAPISWPPRTNEGNVPLILDTVKNDFSYEKDKPTIFLTFDFPQINGPLFADYLIEDPSAFILVELYSTDPSYKTLFQKINKADYLLTKTGRVYDEPRKGQYVVRMIERFNKALRLEGTDLIPNAFKPIKNTEVPIDGSMLIIYKKTRAIEAAEWLILAHKLSRIDSNSSHEISESIQQMLQNRK